MGVDLLMTGRNKPVQAIARIGVFGSPINLPETLPRATLG